MKRLKIGLAQCLQMGDFDANGQGQCGRNDYGANACRRDDGLEHRRGRNR